VNNLDTVRDYLQSFGQREIPIDNLQVFASKSPLSTNKFFAAFYRLRAMGEFETQTVAGDGGKRITTAIVLHKMPSAETIIRKEAAKLNDNGKQISKVEPSPLIADYIAKKSVLSKIVKQLADTGFNDPENMINFEPDPWGEEAVALFELVNRSIDAINELYMENKQLKRELKIQTDINARYKESKAFKAEDYTEAK